MPQHKLPLSLNRLNHSTLTMVNIVVNVLWVKHYLLTEPTEKNIAELNIADAKIPLSDVPVTIV